MTAPLPRLIGITGKAGSGKDTIGDYLHEACLYQKVSFAAPIRRGIRAIFNLPSECFEHPAKEHQLPEIDKSPRQLMQTLGTEWGRKLVHPDLWLILADSTIRAHWNLNQNVAITDVRFENEAQMVRKMGGVIWHINRKSAGTKHSHASEDGVFFHPNHDIIIDNNTSIEDLHGVIEKELTSMPPHSSSGANHGR